MTLFLKNKMISFSNLGSLGRLGNQMFQYAALKGISAYHSTDYCLPKDTSLHKCFQIPNKNSDVYYPTIKETSYEFDEKIFNLSEGDLYGFFQTEKYFSHIEQELRKDFRFCDIVYETCSHYRKYILSEKVVALHVRRGDYITDSNFCLLEPDYYLEALTYFPDLEIMVLSDDINWCREQFKSERFKFSFSNNPFIDLCLMSLCDYHIISNSSFSWWGSWLAKSKKTIAPQKWFMGEFSSWNTKDLYKKDWILI
jgi:hypothetical protein